LLIIRTDDHKSVLLSINGDAIAQKPGNALPYFQDALAAAKHIVINFTDTRLYDAHFLGLLIMLSKRLKRQQLHLTGLAAYYENISASWIWVSASQLI
jgi:hypothetical protein